MHRRGAMLAMVGIPAIIAMASKGRAMTGTRDRQAVRQLVDRYAATWNTSDMDAMAALYADNVHWVNIVGMHWQGRAQVDHAHRVYFDLMFKGVPLRLEEIESVMPLPGGAMVVVVRWAVGAFTTPAGDRNPPSRDRMTLVLVPQGDRLVIAHGSNVQIVEAAQKFDPTKRASSE